MTKQFQPPILICSCESTKDIALHMVYSLDKFIDKPEINVLMGSSIKDDFTNLKLTIIETPQTNWKLETIYQLKTIKFLYPTAQNVLLLLDDFIFKSTINWQLVCEIEEKMNTSGIKYILLKPSADSFLMILRNYFNSFSFLDKIKLFKIRKNHPYYFSLQACLWNIDYLISSIEGCKNIWDFENMTSRWEKHLSVSSPILKYQHVVEKGQWDFSAEAFCKKHIGFFISGTRSFRKAKLIARIKFSLRKYFIFPIFGYSFYRLRSLLIKYK